MTDDYRLTSVQQWRHDHITRCTCCGSWEIVGNAELKMRSSGMLPLATSYSHLEPFIARNETRA